MRLHRRRGSRRRRFGFDGAFMPGRIGRRVEVFHDYGGACLREDMGEADIWKILGEKYAAGVMADAQRVGESGCEQEKP